MRLKVAKKMLTFLNRGKLLRISAFEARQMLAKLLSEFELFKQIIS